MNNKRIEQIQSAMKEQSLDAVLLCLSENVVMVSQYWPRNGFSYAFIPQLGEPTLIVPAAESMDATKGSIQDIRPFGWVRLIDGDPFENILMIVKELKALNKLPNDSKIGVERNMQAVAPALCDGETFIPGMKTLEVIGKAFPSGDVVAVNDLINEIRSIKTEEDIKRLHLTNHIAHDGLQYFKQIVERPGLREIDVAAMVESYIARNASRHGARYARAWAQVSSGIRTADSWFAGIVSGDRNLENGDLVMIEMCTVADGYYCDLTLTHYVGEIDSRKMNMINAVLQAQQKAISKVKSGVKCAEIDAEARKVLAELDLEKFFVHHTGHGVGFAYHEPLPVLAPSSSHFLKTGMVHTVEPGVYIPDMGGVRFELNVLVEESGSTILGI